MGSYLVKLLTNPENFKFYAGGTEGQVGYASNATAFGQKNIPYGKDRPGGGDSGQPFIPKNIQIGVKNSAFYNDFIVRGGIEAPLSALEDVARLSKYFLNLKNPSGLLFTAKQNLLSRVGIKTEASKGLGYLGGFLNEGAYTPLSTIAQAGIGWAGGHLNKQGLDPTGLLSFQPSVLQAVQGASNFNATKGFKINSEGKLSRNEGISFAIRKYGDVAYENNSEENNNVKPTVDYETVPDSLYRKAQRASNNLENKTEATANAKDKYLTREMLPPNSVNAIRFNSNNPRTSPSSPNLKKFENKVDNFLIAFDQYREKRLAKKLTNKENQQLRAEDRLATSNKALDDAIASVKEKNQYAGYLASISRPLFANRLLNLWDTTGLNISLPIYTENNPELYSYGGGPGSVLGIGKTKILFATLNDNVTPARTGVNMVDPYLQYGRRTVEYKTTNIFGKTFMPNSYGSVSLTYAGKINPDIPEIELFGVQDYLITYNNKDNLQSFSPENLFQNSKTKFATWPQSNFNAETVNLDSTTKEDFRKILDPSFPPNQTFLSISPSYIDNNIEKNFNLGNPGKKGNITSYTAGKKSIDGFNVKLGPVDKVTASPIYKTNTIDGSRYPNKRSGNSDDNLKDIIPFFIAILNNDNQVGGTYKKYMHFRAFIDSFSDSYDAEWKSLEYMGRAEKFYKYGGFDRQISMAFTIVAQSREEITIMYDKLNFLASSLAPEYLDSYTSGYMAGNIAYITLGGYLDDQPGVITSLTFDIPEESPWEIGIDDGGNELPVEDVRQVPHMIKVTGIKFIPIHKFRPQKQSFKNDKLGTNSTRLLNTGKQRYIDQLRPETANYDKENLNPELNELKEAESAAERIALLNYAQQNILLENSSFLTVDPNQAQTPLGIDNVTNNQGLINTLQQQ